MTSPSTLEEKMAVISAGKLVRTDDITITRFRFLLDSLQQASGQPREQIAGQIAFGRNTLEEEEQRESFIEKFGREPGPDDPVFFDSNASDDRSR
jgi:hypothetical protein